ncbi:hypothetical protein CEXT_777111 [Caerostris extrusa]|uniref:Uncharacterized protein n=1 Tax=Caerostris extrusa TaxID=172846 RepID=A0AAV4V6T4_CAEEX|nr:hypothetical protein CEXT_777111 [Caerostris extrusa]
MLIAFEEWPKALTETSESFSRLALRKEEQVSRAFCRKVIDHCHAAREIGKAKPAVMKKEVNEIHDESFLYSIQIPRLPILRRRVRGQGVLNSLFGIPDGVNSSTTGFPFDRWETENPTPKNTYRFTPKHPPLKRFAIKIQMMGRGVLIFWKVPTCLLGTDPLPVAPRCKTSEIQLPVECFRFQYRIYLWHFIYMCISLISYQDVYLYHVVESIKRSQ